MRLAAAAALVVSVTAGCGGAERVHPGAEVPTHDGPAHSRPTSPARPGTSSTTVPAELDAREALRVTPPPAERVQASREGTAVLVTWAPPMPVTVPHTYGDRVVEYRVYRLETGGKVTLVGATTALHLRDGSPVRGSRYAVSTVREHGVEGGGSVPVAPRGD